MQPAIKHQNKIKKHSHTIWLLTSMLTVLVIATAAVLGMCFYIYANPSDSKIDLYKGEVAQHTNQIRKSKTPENETHMRKYTGTKAKQQAAKNGFDVEDNKQLWMTDTKIDLFKKSYKNANGEITVKSAGKDKVIAPGTDGSYTFDLKNTAKTAADYKVWIEATVSADDIEMPLQTRMSGQNGWLLGNKNKWMKAEDLNGVSTTQRVEAGKTAQYTIYWQWPFEQGNDEADTKLANMEADTNFKYTVTIHTMASQASNTADNAHHHNSDTNKPKSLSYLVKTGDTASILKWALMLGISAGIILVLLLWKKNRHKRSTNKDRQD